MPIIKLSAIYKVTLHSIKDVFVLPLFPFGFTKSKPSSLFLLPLFCFSFGQTLGDLNNDELINIQDLILISNIIIETLEPTDYQLWASDTNNDEIINLHDVLILIQLINGFLDVCNINDFVICPNNYTECCYPITSHQFDVTMIEIEELINWYPLDVKIVNEENIWVGGYQNMVLNDSLINYNNVAYYNGENWQFHQVEFLSSNGFYFTQTVTNILPFSENDVWAFAGKSVAHYNGNTWNSYYLNEEYLSGFITASWGENSDNFWIVGENGARTYKNEYRFDNYNTFLTDNNYNNDNHKFMDVYGLPNLDNVWAMVSYNGGGRVYKYNGENWIFQFTEIPIENEFGHTFKSIYTFGDTLYILSTYGIYKESITTGEGDYIDINSDNFPPMGINSFKRKIRGSHYNDLVVLTGIYEDGKWSHYNGEDWQLFTIDNLDLPENSSVYVNAFDYKDGLMVQVGMILNSNNDHANDRHCVLIKWKRREE